MMVALLIVSLATLVTALVVGPFWFHDRRKAKRRAEASRRMKESAPERALDAYSALLPRLELPWSWEAWVEVSKLHFRAFGSPGEPLPSFGVSDGIPHFEENTRLYAGRAERFQEHVNNYLRVHNIPKSPADREHYRVVMN